jgi:hypothetical protein
MFLDDGIEANSRRLGDAHPSFGTQLGEPYDFGVRLRNDGRIDLFPSRII